MASEIYEQGDTLTVQWVPDHKGVTANEMADTLAREAALKEAPDKDSRKAMEPISAAVLKQRKERAREHSAQPGKENLCSPEAQPQAR